MDEQAKHEFFKKYFSSRDAAKAFGVTNDYIARLCKQGKLKGVLEGRMWFVEKTSAQVFFAGKVTAKVLLALPAPEVLTAKEAAKAYRVTNDYISRLCRQGKLQGKLDNGTWLVERASLQTFFGAEKNIPAPEQASAPMLALPAPKVVVVTRGFSLPRRAFVAALAVVMLFTSAVFAGEVTNKIITGATSAAVAQVESPFFTPFGFSWLKGAIANLFTPKTAPVPLAQNTPELPVVKETTTIVDKPTTTVVEQKTYPVIERTVERLTTVSGIDEAYLTTRLSELSNALRAEIFSTINRASTPYSSGGTTNNIALTQRIDKLDGVALSNITVDGISGLTATDIPVLDYLPISGGTLTGALAVDGATSTFDGIEIATGCLYLNGSCLTSGGSSSTGEAWRITNGYLAPTTTLGILVAASSTIGGGTQTSGLTISGGATTTGNAYIAGSLSLGTVLSATNGGTGTSTPGAWGDVLAWNGANWQGTATSSLGLATTASLQNYLSLASWYATTTDGLDEGSTNLYYTEERLDDRVYSLLQAGSGVLLNYNDGANTLTISSTGGGGGSDVNWTYFNGSGLYPSTSTNQVVIGGSSTSSLLSPLAKLGVFGGASIDYASTTGITSSYASSTAAYLGSLSVGGLTGILKATNGLVSAAVAGTDYINSSFKDWNVVNGYLAPTTTLGVVVAASSTIGSGAQDGGLTIHGGATTTGNAYVAGNVGIGTTSPMGALAIQSGQIIAPQSTGAAPSYSFANQKGTGLYSPAASDLRMAIGGTERFRIAGSVVFMNGPSTIVGSLSTTPANMFTVLGAASVGANFNIAAPTNGLIVEGNTGIGTTTPYSKLTTWGTASLFEAVNSASTTIFKIGQGGATTTALAISSITSALLKTDSSGNVIPAVAGTDYVAGSSFFSYLFPSNATTTLLAFDGGLTAYASSTIGGGTQATGLTISGGATTTGALVLSGNKTYAGASSANNSFMFMPGSALFGTADEAPNGIISPFNLYISGDSVDTTTNGDGNLIGLSIEHAVSATHTGGREAFQSYLAVVGTPSEAPGTAGYVAGQFLARGSANLTGTAGSYATYAGGIFGAHPNVYLTSGATFYKTVNAAEFDVTVPTGASTADKYGMSIVKGSNDAVRGVYDDAAISIADQDNASTPGWKYGLSFGSYAHQWAFGSDSTLIMAQSRQTGPASASVALNGVDFRNVNFATGGYAFASPGFGVTNLGNVGVGSTSPYAKLSIHASSTENVPVLFAVASSTVSATSTLFSISNTGSTTLYQIPSQVLTTNANGTIVGTSSVGVTYGGTGLTATPTYGQLLLGNGTGYTLTATSSLGLATFAYLFPSNATSTLLAFNGGLTAYASSTIGAGTQTTGLTIFGGATTTGNMYIAGSLSLGSALTVANGGTGATTFGQGWLYSDGGTGALAASTSPTVAWLTATSTTATSTFAGGLSVGNGALQYDFSSGVTSIDNLSLGALNFDTDAGILSWIDMPVTSNATQGTVESYTAQIDGNPLLTIYAESNGLGGIQYDRVGIGTTSPSSRLTVWSASTTGQAFEVVNSASTTLFKVFDSGNVGIGTSSPYAKLSVSGQVVAANFVATTTTASVFPYASTTMITAATASTTALSAYSAAFGGTATSSFSSAGALTLAGSLNGPLQANNGVVSATTSIGILYGGTGLTATPTYGQLLVGNGTGYTLTATSSLGLLSALTRDWNMTNGYLAPTTTVGVIVAASSTIGNGNQNGGLTINGGATTTQNLVVQGAGTSTIAGFLAIGNDGSGTYQDANDFVVGSLTGANGMTIRSSPTAATNIFFSDGVSGTAQYAGIISYSHNLDRFQITAGGGGYGTATGMYITSTGNTAIGTTTPYSKLTTWGTGSLFEAVTNASTTIFKIGQSGATTTAFAISSITSSLLKTDANGNVIPAVANTDYSAFSYPFPSAATSTRLTFSGGMLSTASSTIGAGGQTTGLTIFGGATTTGNAYFAGNVGISSTTPWGLLSVNPNGITGPAFVIGSSTKTFFKVDNAGTTTIGDSSGTGDANFQFAADANAWAVGYYATDKSFRIASSTNFGANVALTISKSSGNNVGIASTSPWRTLSVTGTFGLSSSASAESGSDEVLCIDPTTYEVTRGGASCAASSARYKDSVETLNYGLEEVRKLRPVSFTWNALSGATDQVGRNVGFIAEEMLQVVPEVVEIDASGQTQGIDYDKLTSVLASAIQELDLNLQTIASTSATTTAASQAFAASFMQGVFGRVSSWLADAGNGLANIFAATVRAEVVLAKKVQTDELCVGSVCVTEQQFLNLVNGGSGGGSSQQNSAPAPTTETPPSVDTEAPVITLQGANPATVAIGATYADLGAVVTDPSTSSGQANNNLGYTVSLNGADYVSPDQLVVDTATSTTHMITYKAVDQEGNVGTETRTVVVGAVTE